MYNSLLIPAIPEFISDVNGNHVIQKYIININYPFNQELFMIIAKNAVEYSTLKHGCCVVQKFIDYGTEMQKVNDLLRKQYSIY